MTVERTKETKIDFDDARKELGDGPMRFAPTEERSIEEQIASLNEAEKKCFDNLKAKWEKTYEPFSDEIYLRFARCSPGKEKFNEKSAFIVMKSFPRRYLELNAMKIEKQLATKVWFTLSLLFRKAQFLIQFQNFISTSTDSLSRTWFEDEGRSRSFFHVSCEVFSERYTDKNHHR